MDTQELIDLIDQVSADTGKATSTVCVEATGNARLRNTLADRLEYQGEKAREIDEYASRHAGLK